MKLLNYSNFYCVALFNSIQTNREKFTNLVCTQMDTEGWKNWVLARMMSGPRELRSKGKTVQQIVQDALPATGLSDAVLAASLLRGDERFVAGDKSSRWVPAECAGLVAETVIRKDAKKSARALRACQAAARDDEPWDAGSPGSPELVKNTSEDEFSRCLKVSLRGSMTTQDVVTYLRSFGELEQLAYRPLEGRRLYYCIYWTAVGAQAAYAEISASHSIGGSRAIVMRPVENARGLAFIKPSKHKRVDLSAPALRGDASRAGTNGPRGGTGERRVVVFGLPLEFSPIELRRQLSFFGLLEALSIGERGSAPLRRAFATYLEGSCAAAAASSPQGIVVCDSVCRVQLVAAAAWNNFPWPPRSAVPVAIADAAPPRAAALSILRAATAPPARDAELLPRAPHGSSLVGALPRVRPVVFVPGTGVLSSVDTVLHSECRVADALEPHGEGEKGSSGSGMLPLGSSDEAQEETTADLEAEPALRSTTHVDCSSDSDSLAVSAGADSLHATLAQDESWGGFEKHSRGFASRYLGRFGFTGQRE